MIRNWTEIRNCGHILRPQWSSNKMFTFSKMWLCFFWSPNNRSSQLMMSRQCMKPQLKFLYETIESYFLYLLSNILINKGDSFHIVNISDILIIILISSDINSKANLTKFWLLDYLKRIKHFLFFYKREFKKHVPIWSFSWLDSSSLFFPDCVFE